VEAPANSKIATAVETRGLGPMTMETRHPPCPLLVYTRGARIVDSVLRDFGIHPDHPDSRYTRVVLALSCVSCCLSKSKQSSARADVWMNRKRVTSILPP